MARVKSNFLEILFKEIMIGKTIYNGDDAIVINNITYTPGTHVIKVSDHTDPDHVDANNYKFLMKDIFEFEYSEIKIITPNKEKIKGKKNRK
jgi:hypothetical protein